MKTNKNKLFILFIIILLSVGSNAQVNDFTKLTPIPQKGLIKLMDGSEISFKTFKFENDTVIILNKNGAQQVIPSDNIYKVYKIGNYALIGALSSSAGWFIGAILGTSTWKGDLEDKKNGFIYGGTIACGVIGGIIGAFVKREKVLYKSKTYNFTLNSIIINPISIPAGIENYRIINSPIISLGVKIRI
ncbi:MAG: hypothetical protein JEY97_11425 [Bacteroidales bacterium]|nr:hypothetical protein [Bacteroidales bacterium]